MKDLEPSSRVINNNQLQMEHYFSCPIYIIQREDFLNVVNTVSEEALEIKRKDCDLDEIYPVYMSNHYFNDSRIGEFVEFIGVTAWNILNQQGYNMQSKSVQFTDMWSQEHHKHSSMEAHVHGHNSQIVGFYFLETPEHCSRVVFHDPRTAKIQIDLSEKNVNVATQASKMINFVPKAGMMVFTNAWLAHSFTRHASDTPIKFVHFNLVVQQEDQLICNIPTAEII